MRLVSGVLGFALTSVVALSSANAADMYRAPAGGGYKDGPAYATVNWSGWYAGVNGGGAWSEFSDQLACPTFCSAPFPVFGGLSPSGGFGGGQIGYNWQGVWHPHLVLGVEADIQGAGVEDKGTNGAGVFTSRLDFFGTVRGRIGYAMDSSLAYFAGGFAYGGIRNEANFGPVDFVKDTTATGYVLGGGWEYRFSPAWSAKAEYQYINLGKNDPVTSIGVTFSSAGGIVRDDAFHTARVGLNYHLLPGYEPLI
jgi:outer membrane immunogenic protein